MMRKAVFIDKDGTLVEDIPYNVDPALIRLTEGAAEGLHTLKSEGYMLIVVSNQSGVAHGYFPHDALKTVEKALQQRLRRAGVALDALLFCPHHPNGTVGRYAVSCECRKPKPGMILQAARRFNIDTSRSWMVGDILDDIEAGNAAGCRTVLIDNGNETEWVVTENRRPHAIGRNLREAANIIIHQHELA